MILTILKVIGIILLIVLLLIVLILSLVLFAPIRYRFNGEYFEEPDVYANVRYFPVALNAQVSYKEKKLEYTVRMLGGVIMTNTNAKLSWLGRKISHGKDSTEVNLPDEISSEDYSSKENSSKEDLSKDDLSKDVLNNNDSTDKAANNKETGNQTDTDKIKEDSIKNDKLKKSKKKKKISDVVSDKIKLIKGKYNFIKEKLSSINKKKDALLKVYHSKRFEKAKTDVIKYLKSLLKALKPKHLEGNIHFGMEDPATTGEILGGISILLPLYDNCLNINPDFEKQVIEGIIKGNGTIYLCSIVGIALKVILNKNLIKVTKKVKTIIEA